MRRLAAALILAAGYVGCGSAAPVFGILEVRVTDHVAAIAQFRRLDVSVAALALHQKGKGRREGWRQVLAASRPVDIVPLKDGLQESLGEHAVLTGHYDAVRVRFTAATGELKRGTRPRIEAKDTVVALDVVITAHGNSPLVLDLYAEDQTEHPDPRYVVKVKEIRAGI